MFISRAMSGVISLLAGRGITNGPRTTELVG